ncbi:MAG: glucosaminidase domain-containing protein [Bacteroidales bacterium]|nr:glucosaminidase domain-containing protein [Bacteroidales bacterium]
MRKRLIILTIPILIASCKVQQISNKPERTNVSLDRKEYIEKYSPLAIKEMKRCKIPASITLAQALLESDNGNSTLAQKSNNHFGIKCHKSWKGKRVYHDDDKRNECFRKYKTVYESYIDHSNFIYKGQRYQSLFKLKPTNYKAWAKGLQRAGYATSRSYSAMLIKIIEDNNLHRFDTKKGYKQKPITTSNEALTNNDLTENVDNFSISLNKHQVKELNRIDYIVTKQGDTFKSITEEFGMLSFELYKYNELSKTAKLESGQKLFLQPKRSKAEVGSRFHITQQGETMYSISQQYGIKLKSLLKKNLMKKGEEPKEGQKIWLRKIKPHEELVKASPTIEGFDEGR